MLHRTLAATLRIGRKVAIALVGGGVLLAGIAMIVLPGPAFIAIPAGLALLALEFEWANRWLVACELRFQRWQRERSRRRESTGFEP